MFVRSLVEGYSMFKALAVRGTYGYGLCLQLQSSMCFLSLLCSFRVGFQLC